MRGLVYFLLGCADAPPVDSVSFDTAPSDCSESGDFSHFMMRWTKEECSYFDECREGVDYYECVTDWSNTTSLIFDGNNEGWCMDWCAAREAISLWDRAECGGYYPNLLGGDDWEPVVFYVCGETGWP